MINNLTIYDERKNLDLLPRSINKKTWKLLYRVYRMTMATSKKASQDMIVFGTGMVEVKDGTPRHVPIDDWIERGRA